MTFDAVVLSGGRASRLGGTTKATLLARGMPLLLGTVAATTGARRTVVVGDGAPGLPADVLLARETPAFAGPAAGIGAGLDALRRRGPLAELLLVLACDMPGIATAVGVLLAAAAAAPASDGILAIDEGGRRQYLAGVYRSGALSAAVSAALLRHGSLEGLSMRALLDSLRLDGVEVPPGATSDVDTWADAARHGVTDPADAGRSSVPTLRS